MLKKLVMALTMGSGLFAGATQPCSAQDLISTFYDISDKSFSVRAIAPPTVIREFVVCKAVWFAEKKNIRSISLSDPVYGDPKSIGTYPVKVPDGWIALNATVYLVEPNPTGNPMFSVTEKAPACRQMWDWYR